MNARLSGLLIRPEMLVGGLALAAFLALFWALRGAPLGQAAEAEEDEAPGAGYRDRVVAAAVLGLLLVAVGAFVAVAYGIPWSLPLFATGFGMVIVLVRANRRYRHASPTLRRVVGVADAALTASLLAGILIVGNVLAFRYGGRPIDLTRERAFSLSDLTIRQLKALEKPLRFTVSVGESRGAQAQAARVLQLLELYKAENPAKVEVTTLSRYADPTEFEALLRRVPDVAVLPAGGVVLEYGQGETADRRVVSNAEMFGVGPAPFASGPERFESSFQGEDALTSALIRLREGTTAKVAFTTGHGEPSPEELDPRRPGLGLLRSRLEAIGSEVIDLNLLKGEVPADVSLVIVAAPQAPFAPEEALRLETYLKDGGHLLAMVGNAQPTGLEGLFARLGVAIGPGLILDPVYCYKGRANVVFAPIAGLRHPIVESLARRTALLPDAAPLTITGSTEAIDAGVVAVPILRTAPSSWAETAPREPDPRPEPGKEAIGPLVVGAAATVAPRALARAEEEAPRLVLFGSPYLADNWAVQADPVNLDLVLNAVHWLRGKPQLQGIAPKTHVALTLVADEGLRNRLVVVPSILALGAIVGLGVTTYLARRE